MRNMSKKRAAHDLKRPSGNTSASSEAGRGIKDVGKVKKSSWTNAALLIKDDRRSAGNSSVKKGLPKAGNNWNRQKDHLKGRVCLYLDGGYNEVRGA